MRFLSVCSGIEAASVAWNPLGWKAAALAEIEPFPCSLLAHHYPDVPNRGDMTKFKDWPDDAIDLLCGGTPCQSFSVAGLRKGLDDPRGNLMLTFGAIAAKYRPRWLVWENVPGVLSSNGGADFGSFLWLLGHLGYGFSYRVLDAQYFGVAQRRRRVFVVGCFGNWRRAAAVLSERSSMSGHPAPRRQSGQAVTPTIRAGASSGGAGHGARSGDSKNELIVPVARVLTTSNQRIDAETETFIVSHSLRGEGFDASEDGTGRGTPLVPVLPFDTTQITSQANRSNPRHGDPCHPLAAGAHAPAIALNWQAGGVQTSLGYRPDADTAGTLVKDQTQAVAVALRGREGGATAELGDEVGMALRASSGGGDKAHVMTAMQVRRLTPRECERLQGFPDDYTAVPHRGKPAADGPRYKALGNSWAVPCARWIGQRIQQVEALHV